MGEINEKQFEYFDDKKIQALALQEKQRLIQSQQNLQVQSKNELKSEHLNQTMPVKREDLVLAPKAEDSMPRQKLDVNNSVEASDNSKQIVIQ